MSAGPGLSRREEDGPQEERYLSRFARSVPVAPGRSSRESVPISQRPRPGEQGAATAWLCAGAHGGDAIQKRKAQRLCREELEAARDGARGSGRLSAREGARAPRGRPSRMVSRDLAI